jgi:tRNA 2-thiouridine synthesizing protein E
MTIRYNGKTLETDEEGFLLDPAQWNREVAQIIADEEQIEMTPERWTVIEFVRDHFDHRQSVPEARTVIKALGERFGRERATRRFLYDLFPRGYGQQACRIAGMTKPRKLMLDV